MSILTAIKSVVKKIPPIKALIAKRNELRLKVALLSQGSLRKGINPSLINEKLELLDFAFDLRKIHSFADLGAIGLVNGGYTFYALEKYGLAKAVLVDTHPSNAMMEQSKNYPQLSVLKGNFGNKVIANEVGQIDMIILFDILLHQVDPDWDEILELYAQQTQCLVIFNPQWISTNSTTKLLDLGEIKYFENVPPRSRALDTYNNLFQKLDQIAPNFDRKWKDIHHIWQWGITDIDLVEKLNALGFRMQYFRNYGQFENLKNFENHAFIFSK